MLKFKKKLVSKIKELREEQNLPQQELARLVDVSRQTIYYLEKGKYNPSLTLSFKISEIFNKPIEEIFYFEPITKELLGNKTLNELNDVAKITGIDVERIINLRIIDENQLSELYSENELSKIVGAFGLEFEDLFLKDDE